MPIDPVMQRLLWRVRSQEVSPTPLLVSPLSVSPFAVYHPLYRLSPSLPGSHSLALPTQT